MFILELTLRSWNHSEENKRRTLQRNDIAAAITRTDIFDFLVRACTWAHLLHVYISLHRGWPRVTHVSPQTACCASASFVS